MTYLERLGRGAPIYLLVGTLAACGADRPPSTMEDQLAACGLLGMHEVSADVDGPSCGDFPSNGSMVVVEPNDGGEIRVTMGRYELTAAFDAPTCTLTAAGCSTQRQVEDERAYTSYRRVSVELRGGERVDATAIVDIAEGDGDGMDFRSQCFGEATFPLAPASIDDTGCSPEGEYEAEVDAPLVSGECGLTWRAGQVRITEGEAGRYELDWAGTQIDDLELDGTTCTLTGTKGVSTGASFDLWSYNGTNRSASIRLTIDGTQLSGVVDDALDGITSDGVACPGGQFSLSAAAPAGEGVQQVFDSACTVERPVICGDGMCETERGESCVCADCACAEGTVCEGRTGQCLASCERPDDDCGPAMRCSIPGDGNLDATSELFCVPEGMGAEGVRCIEHNDCQAGLICHFHSDRPLLETPAGLCSRPCDTTGPGCERCSRGSTSTFSACTATCSRTMVDSCGAESAFCWNRYSSAPDGVCVAQPEAGLGQTGDACDFDSSMVQCEPPLSCAQTCTGSSCIELCAPPCSSAAECPASLPRCSSIGRCLPD